jgi:LPS-assembly lipoprotein
MKFVLLAGLLLAVSACGFSLRSSDSLSANFSSIQLSTQQPNSELSRLIRRSLESSGVAVEISEFNGSNQELLSLTLGNEQLTSRPITVNPRARAAQHELRLELEVALSLSEQYLISPETLFVERAYFEDIENLNGNQEEIEIITSEMRRELGNQLIRRLSAVSN